MKPVTVKYFDTLKKRDFENGATMDAIRATLRKREEMETELGELETELNGANAMISAIENLVPGWERYRDLAEAVQVEIEGRAKRPEIYQD